MRQTPETVDSSVELTDDGAVINHLRVTDPTAVMLLSTAPESDRPDLADRMIGIGAQGMASMGLGIDLAAIDDRVGGIVQAATGQAETTLKAILDESSRRLDQQFDPNQRTSILARALTDFTDWRDGFLATLDPAVEGSTATVLVDRLTSLVGPDGALEQQIAAAFDLDQGDSALAQLRTSIDDGFAELRQDLARDQAADAARAEEAERGTAHGIEFEDVVESHLRNWAAGHRGCIVERTSVTPGSLNAVSKVGDFVITLDDGRRIVIEAKRHASIALTGSGGILTELDTAMDNRRAEVAICIAGRDAFPTEVGRFNVYGNRILAVDEGDGTLVTIALQWAAAVAQGTSDVEFDHAAAVDRIDRIRKAAEQLSAARRSITTIRSSLDQLHEQLGGLRGDILDHVADLDRTLAPTRHLD